MMKPATIENVAPGTLLVADAGFTCLTSGEVGEVQNDEGHGLYVPCRDGRHYLDGQLDEGTRYIGFSLLEKAA